MSRPGRRDLLLPSIGPATRLFRTTGARNLTHANAVLTAWHQARYAGAPDGTGSPPSPATALQDHVRRNAALHAEWEAEAARSLAAWLADTSATCPDSQPTSPATADPAC